MTYDGSITIKTALDNNQVINDLRELARLSKEAADKISNIAASARRNLEAQVKALPRINNAYREQLALVTQIAAQTKTFDASRKATPQTPATATATVSETGVATVSAIDKVSAAYERQTQIVERLQEELNAVKDTQTESAEYADLQKRLDAIGRQLDANAAKQQKMIDLAEGVKNVSGTKAFLSLQYDAEKLREVYDEIIAKQQEMVAAGTAFVPKDTSGLQAKLAAAQDRQASMLERLSERYQALRGNIRTVESAGVQAHRRVADEGEKAHKRLNKHAKINFNTVMKYVFGIRSVFFAYRKLRAAAKEALGLMAQSDPQLNKVISNFLTSVKQLKADVGTLIQPLVSTLTPALTILFEKLHSVILGFSEFLAALVGQDYIEVATVKTVDWADSLDDVGDAAKNTAKQLSALDKLNVISDSGADSAKDTAKSLELTKDTVQYVKKQLDGSKWYVKLGEKLSGVFQDAINWLKKKLKNPEQFLTELGIAYLGIKLGKMLLGGIARSGFSAGISGLIPKAALITLTAVVFYKIGNKIFNSLPEGMKDELADTVGGYVEAYEAGGVTGAIAHWGDEVVYTITETADEIGTATKDLVDKVKNGKLFEDETDAEVRMPKPYVKPLTEEEKRALEIQATIRYAQIATEVAVSRAKFKQEAAAWWDEVKVPFTVAFETKFGVTPEQWLQTVKNKITDAWNNPKNPVKIGATVIKNAFTSLTGGIFSKPQTITTQDVSGFLKNVASTFKSSWDNKGNPVKTTFNTIKTSFSTLWNNIFGTGKTNDGQSITDAVTKGLNAVSSAAGSSGSALNSALYNVGKKITEGINKGTISVPVTFTGQATPAGANNQTSPKINTTITITLDGKTISKTVFNEAEKASKQTGTGAAAKLHYVLA